MDVGSVLHTMRDPAGIPSHPVVFQVLMIVTWIFHIAFVHMTLGTAGLAIYAFYKRRVGTYWEQLSMAMTKSAKVGVSLLIVLGVAPLLFTQVIYDPQWYTASVLSARWLIAFIFTLIIGYCSWFVFYYSNHKGARKRLGIFALVGLALFLLDGLIMHVLAYQSLLPDQWMSWYAPGGSVDTRGAKLHAIQWPRYLFIISLSLPALGLYLIAYADYFRDRADRAADYLAFTRRLGLRFAVNGSVISFVLLLAWQFVHPAATGLAWHPVGWLLAAALLGLGYFVRHSGERVHGYLPLLAGLCVLGVLAVWRELIRIRYMIPYGYDIRDYTVHADWPSMALFFSTFVGVGGLVGGFFLITTYRAGQVQGLYKADKIVARMGTAAVAVLGLWITIFFAYGIAIWMRNAFAL
ncbi:hypothetical protein [Variovorax sp. 770b2]|uniref:hypothetical protein n=1 Tax=Variovorax sp. 770b2 TaxID=1566271 RepID=UPI0008E1CB42|nr:hypothetical protein [Variovorax sp. 770b2]SFQ33042.1 hypothetical protein SAMN03159339_6763 [Variovorax sp. 770b2]